MKNSRERTPEDELRKTNSEERTQENELGGTSHEERIRTKGRGEQLNERTERIRPASQFLRIRTQCSGTPGIEATKQNERTGSKPNYKGWVGRTAPEFAVGLTRTTASDFLGNEGDFGNSWKRGDCSDRQLNEETVSPY